MRCHNAGLGSSPVARHYWGNHYCFLFLEVLRCFSSLRLPHCTKAVIITLQVIGLSHSEILGSKDICSYPKLIAAYHVLHRLREPRHPPEALTYFRHNQLILLAVVEISRHLHIKNIEESNDSVQFYYKVLKLYYSLVYQYVKDRILKKGRVENNGFEPLTPCLQSRCSSQLS